MIDSNKSITIAIAWCLAWGDKRQPQFDLSILQQMRQALTHGEKVPEQVEALVEQVQRLQGIDENYFPDTLEQLKNDYPDLWEQKTQIALVYGGATKIKQYVFEAAKLPDIRGASAILDRINLVDIPAFFGEPQKSASISRWLKEHFPELETALIKELLIYYKGGNILAFCPAAFVDELANAIEKRYTEETLTANSCAVGDTFRLLEIRFGLLQKPLENTPWLNWYHRERENPLVQAYFGTPDDQNSVKNFQNRKSFNEIVSKLTILFNQRRGGNDFNNRPTRRYPPMFETHPYLQRDEGERRLAVAPAKCLPDDPWFSDTLARKRIVGQRTKREDSQGQGWYKSAEFRWQSGQVKKLWKSGQVLSWVFKFEQFLKQSEYRHRYYQDVDKRLVKEARSLTEISNASDDFVAYIYADGNNMGGYIQTIRTPEKYQEFSQDVFHATENAVYQALAQHLNPHRLQGLADSEYQHRNQVWIHPFEIVAIGGDDVLLVVPANKALAIAKTIGEEFERLLVNTGHYNSIRSRKDAHRYQGETPPASHCELSMSIGVLITAHTTPIYYAKNLYEQLLKSAKKRAKDLKKEYKYNGGTVDFLTMKSVTMISSSIESFRKDGLTKEKKGQPTLKLYAAPYTLHELGGLLKTVEALKKSEFPRSQLYQIRSLLEQGKHTAILNYRYFRVRLQPQQQKLLEEWFEKAWCQAKTNNGNIAPWMSILTESASEKPPDQKSKKQNSKPLSPSSQDISTYETIWRELVELYPFIDEFVTQRKKEVTQ